MPAIRARPAAETNPAAALVVENARRLVSFYERQGEGADGAGSLLLRDWRARGQADPDALVRHVREFFNVPPATPVRSFLQSAALLPGAHYPGCHRAA